MQIIPLFVAIPLGAAFFIPMVGRKNPRLSDTLANITTLALFLMALSVELQPAASLSRRCSFLCSRKTSMFR